jgi:hypothetical protein
MVRLLSLCAVIAMLGTGRPALSTERAPVCRIASVVEEMQRQIRIRDYYGWLDRELVQERPTMVANLVQCDVCVLDARYDMPSFGPRPFRRCIPAAFEVRMLEKGYLVRNLP